MSDCSVYVLFLWFFPRFQQHRIGAEQSSGTGGVWRNGLGFAMGIRYRECFRVYAGWWTDEISPADTIEMFRNGLRNLGCKETFATLLSQSWVYNSYLNQLTVLAQFMPLDRSFALINLFVDKMRGSIGHRSRDVSRGRGESVRE